MACLWAGILSAGVINYQADDATIFPNPERGFTDQLGGEVALTDSKPNVVKREEDWYWDIEDENYDERKNQSIVMLMYYLKNYRTKDLSDKLLQRLEQRQRRFFAVGTASCSAVKTLSGGERGCDLCDGSRICRSVGRMVL